MRFNLNNNAVVVTTAVTELQDQAEQLAKRLSLPYLFAHSAGMVLQLTTEGLELRLLDEQRLGPVKVDFLQGALAHRRLYGGGKRQHIARAIGIQKQVSLKVLDLSAGLGRDAFVLALLGCRVTMLERSPVIAALLQDGLQRARQQAWFAELHLQLFATDALSYLTAMEMADAPEVIYFDPMFPERQKSALVKKEMRVLRAVIGDDEDADAVLQQALKRATKRVVVKRPRHAPCLPGRQPDHAITGKSSRFDVYMQPGVI